MKIERGSVSSRDFMFAVFCFMQATVLRSGYIISITRQDSWSMPAAGFLIALPLVAIYASLLKRFPGKNLFEIDDIAFGPVLGKIVSALYLFFFGSLVALNARDLGNFVLDYMMPETPMAVVFFVFLIGCVYAIRKGMSNLLQLCTLFFIISMTAIVINSILILRDVQPGFLKPLFRLPPIKYVQGAVSVASLPMGEILAFTMLAPMLGKDTKASKPLILGLLLCTLSMTMVIVRDIITLGPLVAIVSLPSFESVRYISVSGFLTRMESIYAVILILLFLFKITVLLYSFALGLTQLFNPRSSLCEGPEIHSRARKSEQPPHTRPQPPILLVCTALMFFYSLFVFDSVMENMDWGATTAPFFSLTFELVLPAITLLSISLRKLGKNKEAKA